MIDFEIRMICFLLGCMIVILWIKQKTLESKLDGIYR